MNTTVYYDTIGDVDRLMLREHKAVSYYDAWVKQYTWRGPVQERMFRHYFNAEGTEVGYLIPMMLSFPGHGIHTFETPRVWGIPHFLTPLMQECNS